MPKSPAERKADERERRRQAGMKEYRRWVWPWMVALLDKTLGKLMRRGKDG